MILVTGATGFLGAELAHQLLQTQTKLRCLKRVGSEIPDSLKNNSNIEWFNADILDYSDLEDAFQGITQVYHCAAKVSFSKADKALMTTVNVEGTANIVNLCMDYGIKLVHVSSIAALGNAKPGEFVTEKNFWDAYDKNGIYAESKYRSEMEVWRGIHENLDAVIVNPSVIIGENIGESGSGELFKLVADGLKYYPTGNIAVVDVSDVAQSMIKLMNSEISGERFLINSENYSYQKFFTEIALAYGATGPHKKISKFMLSLMSKLSALSSLFFKNSKKITQDVVSAAFSNTVYSNQKIVDTLGIKFIPVSESIEKTVTSLKK